LPKAFINDVDYVTLASASFDLLEVRQYYEKAIQGKFLRTWYLQIGPAKMPAAKAELHQQNLLKSYPGISAYFGPALPLRR
jgi:hypothetical protein